MRNLGLSLLYCVLFLGVGYVWPFVLAMLFAAAIEPMVRRIQRHGVPRGLAVLLALGVFVTLVTFFVTLVLSKFVKELGELYASLPEVYLSAVELVSRVTTALAEALRGLPLPLGEHLTFQVEPIYRAVQTLLVSILVGAGNLPALLLGFLVCLIATFFMSKDREILGKFASGLAPSDARKQIVAANKEVISTFVAIMRAQVMLATVTGVLSSLGLWVFKFGSPLVLGVVCGLLDLLPFFGPSLVYLSMIFWGIGTGNFALSIKAGMVFAVVAGVRQLLEPRVIGRAAGMHPLASLFSIYVGVKLLGPMGFILGPLAAVVLRALIRARVLPAFDGGRHK
ncbi:MAG: sporulation integral membrane protein YtvI [Firmicutes bacterium]|nr:sporulation integral membrane protein YtvI [Bacillota bacterium]